VSGGPGDGRPPVPYAVLIPARWGSTRLPGKVLLRASGRYLVEHTYERARRAPGVARVCVLVDDDRVEAAARAFGAEVCRTRGDHASGTDRCAEAAAGIPEAVVVNLQADEPLVEPRDLAALAGAVAAGGCAMATLAHPFESPAARASPHAVKVRVRPDGLAADFSRGEPGPGASAPAGPSEVLHHLGIYAFPREGLLAFAAMPPSPRERAERLEQLRALEAGWRIRVLPASAPGAGVDTPADYAAFLARLAAEAGSGGGRPVPPSG
jgi:3-deoxy-manno-octulosonate cytidylyltransferase (CMP-KDO synthetase)